MDQRDDRLDVIFVLSDQHRVAALNYADDELVETPNLDDLAAQGTRFERVSPTCRCARRVAHC